MIVSSPDRAVATLPDTGASRMPAPVARTAGATARIVPGRTVLMSAATAPARSPATTPSGPPYSAATAASSATIEITTSDASRRLGRPSPPRWPRCAWRAPRRAPASGCRARPMRPLRDSRSAMAEPIRPVPSTATRSPRRRARRRRRRAQAASSRRLFTVSTIRSTDGTARSSSVAADGQRDVRGGDPHDRRVKAVEAVVRDDRGDLGAPAAQPRVLLDGEQPARLLDRGEDRRRVERHEASAGR